MDVSRRDINGVIHGKHEAKVVSSCSRMMSSGSGGNLHTQGIVVNVETEMEMLLRYI